MVDFEVEPRRLTETAAALDAAARAIDEELQALARASSVLTKAWEGEAARSYQQLASRFHAESRDQVIALAKAAASLDELAREYRLTDVRGAKAVPQIASH